MKQLRNSKRYSFAEIFQSRLLVKMVVALSRYINVGCFLDILYCFIFMFTFSRRGNFAIHSDL